jgi:putative RNA 2'-phosphotransferase
MTDPIYRCPDHGFQTVQECSDCGEQFVQVLSGPRRRQLSKFMSGALRHFPGDVGLTLDDYGWAATTELIAAVRSKYDWADSQAVEAVISQDPKGRFERRGERIRAAYGHSVDVTIEREAVDVPDTLYHGTAPDNIPSIKADGLRPMNRQAVHLTDSQEEARKVGERHAADPVVLRVSSKALQEQGLKISKDGKFIYTVEHVPPACIENLPE